MREGYNFPLYIQQVVALEESRNRKVDIKYYMLDTVPCTADGTDDELAEDVGAKLYLKAGRLYPLDEFSFTHGPYTKVFGKSFNCNSNFYHCSYNEVFYITLTFCFT